MRTRLIWVSLVLVLGLGGCAGDDSTVGSSTPPTGGAPEEADTSTLTTETPIVTASTTPAEGASETEELAATLLGIFDNLDLIQSHYSGGIAGMSRAMPSFGGSSSMAAPVFVSTAALETLWNVAAAPFAQQGPSTEALASVPAGFRDAMGPGGIVSAPPGACGAGAAAEAVFTSAGGTTITPEVLAEHDIATIDFGMLAGTPT